MKGAEILVKSLKIQGVKHIFGIPGNHVLSLYDALRNSNIKTILATHEPSVGFMADAYGRVTREPGIAVVTAGPGALNLVNSVAQAYVESSPMVIIAAQCHMDKLGRGCYHEMEHPEVQYNIFKDITKWRTKILKPEEISEKISEAFYQARVGRQRPVYIEIPENVFEEECEYFPSERKFVKRKKAEENKINNAVKLLLDAKFPIIFAGGGVIDSGALDELKELSELLEIPVATTLMGKSSIPENHHLSLGCGSGGAGNLAAREIMPKADVMLAVGCRFDEVGTGFFTVKIPKTLIHIDIDDKEINRNYKASLGIVGDAKTVLIQIITKLKKEKKEKSCDLREAIQKLKTQELNEMKREFNSEKIHPLKILYKLNKLLDKNSIIVADTGNSLLWVHEFLLKSQLVISPAGYNSMGFAVPSVISAKLAAPDKTIVGICGDGSFLMTGMELITAVRYQLDIKLFVLHENRYNILTVFQDIGFGGRYSDTLLQTFNFAEFANNAGALGIKISKVDEIESKIKEGLNHKGPVLFDVYIDANFNPSFLNRLKKSLKNKT